MKQREPPGSPFSVPHVGWPRSLTLRVSLDPGHQHLVLKELWKRRDCPRRCTTASIAPAWEEIFHSFSEALYARLEANTFQNLKNSIWNEKFSLAPLCTHFFFKCREKNVFNVSSLWKQALWLIPIPTPNSSCLFDVQETAMYLRAG